MGWAQKAGRVEARGKEVTPLQVPYLCIPLPASETLLSVLSVPVQDGHVDLAFCPGL